jgi:pilus assembly protein CpaE
VLIAVLSAKGGVGRSFIAANLAACLAERTPTALVDLDLQFGDISSWGEDGTVDRTSIDQLAAVVATGEVQLEDVRAVARARFGKVVLLPGTRSPLEGSTWASERGARAQRLVQSLRKWYAVVVVDGLPGVLEPVIRIARMSTLAVVVSGCDAGSLRATQRYLELLDRFAPVPRLVIANRVDRGEPRPLVAKAIGVGERTVYLKEDRTFARRLVVEGLAAPQQRGRPLARGFLALAELVERMAAAAAPAAQ